MQYYCGYIFKAFAQRCALNLSGKESLSRCQQLRVRVIIFVLDRQQRNTSVFLEPPMLFSQQGEREKTKEHRKYSADTHSLAYNGNNHFCDSNAKHCYLNLSEDMVEDNPLD
jgi:hypothetical protein